MKKILSFYPRYDAMSEKKPSHATVPLKVSTNEKRDGLNFVSIERSRFKLFTLKFSTTKNQCRPPSCERAKTTRRRVFLLFENNNCCQITAQCLRDMNKSEKIAYHVLYIQKMQLIFPLIQTSRGFVALFEKIYDGEPILIVFSLVWEDLQHRNYFIQL
jgi:hypothetical protein